MVAIPLIARGKAAAVLYADSAALDTDAINLEALETLVRVAGMAVELLVGGARSAPQPQPAAIAAEPAVVAATTPPPAEPESSAQPQEAAAPEREQSWEDEAGETPTMVAEAPVREEEEGTDYAEPSDAQTPVEEVGEETLVMEAPQAQAEEYAQPSTATDINATVGKQQAEPSTSESGLPTAPLGGGRSWRSADAAELPVEVSDEERRLHNDARRFARLLVSEIKLYNEQKVRDGRLEGDLYERLREDIDRSRQMYDKRVAPPVAARYDYFHQELVNTLAEGDPSKLGADYPGAAA
jgi:hypothetical protein